MGNMKVTAVLALCVFLCAGVGFAQPMAGVYTINAPGGGPRDYTTFTAAANAVNADGIGDTVVFDVYAVSGDYNEQVLLKTYAGSTGKWVKFRAADGQNVRVYYAAAWNTGVVQNSGNAVNYKLENLTLECVSSGQGNALYINGTCPGWAVRNCRLINSSTSGSAGFKATSAVTGDSLIGDSITVVGADGINVQAGTCYFDGNVITNTGTGVCNGIITNGAAGTFVNNRIMVASSNGRGMNISNSSGVFNLYYNSILLTGNISGGFAPVWASISGTLNMRNNILMTTYNSASAYALFISWVGTLNEDYDDLVAAGGNVAYYGVAYTLAAWQGAGRNVNGISADPGFVDTTNLHLASGSSPCVGMGLVTTGFPKDCEGDVRKTGVAPSGPDIGADEFTDAPAIAVTVPAGGETWYAGSNQTITWTNSGGAASRDSIWYSTTGGAPWTLVATDNGALNYPWSVPNTPTTDAIVQVKASNNGGAQSSTAVSGVFTIATPPTPGAFTLTSPGNGATGVAISGMLDWTSSAAADSYIVYMDQNNPPTTVVSRQTSGGTSYGYGPLPNLTTYYWTVIAKNLSGTTSPDVSPFSFMTGLFVPLAFNLSTPVNNAANVPVADTLTWTSSFNADSFIVYLDQNPSPTTVVSRQAGSVLNYAYSGLANATAYYWKVEATNAGGTTPAANAPFAFGTIPLLPTAPTALAPTGIDLPVAGTHTWTPGAGGGAVDSFVVWRGTGTPVRVGNAGTDTFLAYSGLTNATTYNWYVVAWNAAGSAAATQASFTTIPLPPGAPTPPIVPAYGAISVPTIGSLTWTAGAGGAADSFVVYLSTDNPPTDTRLGSVAGTVRTIPYSWLVGNTVYYWTVTAYNSAGSATPVSAWEFTTAWQPALAGVYTINAPGGGDRDFPSLTAAANTVNAYGISDTVIFDAYAVSGDYHEQVSLKTWAGPGDKWVKFRAADGQNVRVYYAAAWNTGVVQNSGNAVNYKLENLTLECVSSGQGNALYINGTCPGWAVRNCRLINTSTSGSAGFKATSAVTGDSLINDSITVVGADGINVQAGTCYFDGNVITNTGTGVCNGIITNGAAGTFVNNRITVASSNGRGMNISNSSGVFNLYYNSILLTGNISGGFAPVWASISGALNMRNNILMTTYNSASAYALFISWVGTLNEDYDDLVAAGGNAAYHDSAFTFSGWQAAGQDSNGIDQDPGFVSTTDLHLASGSSPCVGKGLVITGFPNDCEGDVRKTGVAPDGPDIGADEFALPPDIAVIAPAAGDTWYVGASDTIVWTNTGGAASRDSIWYSTTGNAPWTLVATDNGALSCPWTVPNTPTADAVVQVKASNMGGAQSSTALSGTFTISPLPPTVLVTAPNGGETWTVGVPATITCTHGGGPAVTDSICLSTDSGATWTFLLKEAADSMHSVASVPNSPTAAARIQITAIGATGLTGADASDSNFAIVRHDAGVSQILAPTDGQVFGSTATVTPQARVNNYGTVDEPDIPVTFTFAAYADTQHPSVSLVPGSFDQSFTGTTPAPGYYTANCATSLPADFVPGNDTAAPVSFLVMDAPTGLTPDGGVWLTSSPLLDWADLAGVAGSSGYHIQVATDSGFLTIVLDQTSTPSQLATSLPSADNYYWRVRGVNVLSGPWSARAHFRLDAAVPMAPVLLAPTPWQQGVSTTPVFDWTDVTAGGLMAAGVLPTIGGAKPPRMSLFGTVRGGSKFAARGGRDASAITYHLRVATDTGFNNVVISADPTASTYSYTGTPLTNNARYYWRVNASDAAGNVGPWGGPDSFRTVVAVPAGFALLTPANGALNQPIVANLTWQASARADSFAVYFGTANPPTTLLRRVAGNVTSTAYSGANGQLYYWSVVAENAGGNTTATGAPWHFTTIVAAPTAFTLLAPADSAIDQPIGGSLIWQASVGADSFAVYFDTISPPTTLLRRVAGNVPTTLYSGALNRLYYWSVVAENAGGSTTATGAPWHFRTIPGSGVVAESAAALVVGMAVTPNPVATGHATLRYGLPRPGRATLNVYDATGRSVLAMAFNTGRTGSTPLDLHRFSAGVYLVRLSAPGFTSTQRLIIDR